MASPFFFFFRFYNTLNLARLLEWILGFNAKPVHVRSVAEKMAVGRGFIRVCRFSSAIIIFLVLHTNLFVYYRRYISSAHGSVVTLHT